MQTSLTQRRIDFVGHRKPYYAVVPQIRSAVQSSTYTDIHSLPKQPQFVPWKGIMIMSVSAALTYLALYMGWLDFLKPLFI